MVNKEVLSKEIPNKMDVEFLKMKENKGSWLTGKEKLVKCNTEMS